MELETRRQVERKLMSFGLTYQDVATAIGVDTGSVVNDLKKIGEVTVVFDTSGLTNIQRRNKAFNCAIREWFSIVDVSDYTKRLDIDQEVARSVINALYVYLNMKRINGVIDGVFSSIQSLINPTDPAEYVPYRHLLNAVFHQRKSTKEGMLSDFRCHLSVYSAVEWNRDNFPLQLASWALYRYNGLVLLPLSNSVKVAVDEVLGTLPSAKERDIIKLRFGLSGEEPLSPEEIGARYSVLAERIKQFEAKALRHLRYPDRARRLEIFLESPYNIAQGEIDRRFKPPDAPTYPLLNDLLDWSIDDLELSVRSSNVLKANGINTVRELVQRPAGYEQGGMLRLKNFGRKSLNEIKEVLESMGLCFGMKLEDGSPRHQLADDDNW